MEHNVLTVCIRCSPYLQLYLEITAFSMLAAPQITLRITAKEVNHEQYEVSLHNVPCYSQCKFWVRQSWKAERTFWHMPTGAHKANRFEDNWHKCPLRKQESHNSATCITSLHAISLMYAVYAAAAWSSSDNFSYNLQTLCNSHHNKHTSH